MIFQERIHLYEQHKTKVQQLASELERLEESNCDKLAILNCREEYLTAKRDMIAWEKNNTKTQVREGEGNERFLSVLYDVSPKTD